MIARCALWLIVVAGLALAGCGAASENTAPNQDATLLLDGPPRAVHAGVYTAVARGYDEALGAVLTIEPRPPQNDSAKRLASGGAQFALLPIEELALARERGRDVVGVMAIVQQPRMRVAGAPPYPALLLCTGRITLQDEPNLVRATLAAVARGYQEVIGDPETGVMNLLAASKGLDRAAVARELDHISPDFTAGARVFGQLDPERLRAWAAWAKQSGNVRRAPDVMRMFDGRYVPRSGSRD